MLIKPTLNVIKPTKDDPIAAAHRGKRQVRFGSSVRETDTGDREKLFKGITIEGPALIEEHASTTVLHPGDTLEVDQYGNLIVTVEGRTS